jgi:outer membrane protein OmpA-like peptidoglycan-associated protein
MASKQYSFLAGALCLLASSGFAQTPTTSGSGYDVADSTVVPSRRAPQQTEFMQGTYNFPAKPRSMWEIGIKGGSFNVSGDVPTKFFTPGFGLHVRKALGYVFSLRLEYMYGVGKGLNWNTSSNFGANTGLTTNLPAAQRYVANGANRVFYNYKTNVQDLALEGVITLNNVRFHKAKSGFNIYALLGIGATTYDTKINALNGTSGNYQTAYNAVTGFNDYKNRKEVKDRLEEILDDDYETPAENDGNRRPKLGGKTLLPVGHIGAGIAFRLSKRINLAIEDRYTITRSDLIDGQRWAEQGPGAPVLTPDYDNYNYLSVGLNFNVGAKSVEPLWWLNPLDYAYQEIRKPRLMILPKPVLPDTDGDGVTDQFDQEVTPQGSPVDAHGVSLDTDGDGVPDSRDKEKITPTTCQPVDADGVGKCPVACPDSTCPGFQRIPDCAAALGNLPSIAFTGNTSRLNESQKVWLAGVAATLRNNPNCRISVVGYCTESKAKQSAGTARAENVRKYLVESEGISNDRITVLVGQQGGDCNTVDLRGE